MLIKDIPNFIYFANFYQYFIQSFGKIAALLIFLLKTTWLFEELALKVFKTDDNKIVNVNNSRTKKTVVNSSKNTKFRNLIYIPKIKTI